MSADTASDNYKIDHGTKTSKNLRFDEEPSTIPPSKNYKSYDHHSRKDAILEFKTKYGTYVGSIVIGIIMIILGSVLTWVGSRYGLRDFHVIGPACLILGCIMAVIGSVLLTRAILKAKRANLRVVQGETKVKPGSVATLSDHSFITTSEVSVHGLQSRITSPELYDGPYQSGKSTPTSVVLNTENSLDVTQVNNNNNLYSESEITVSPPPADAAGKDIKDTETCDVVDENNDVRDSSGHVYHISIPNEVLSVDRVDYINNPGAIPDPAVYLEPSVNSDNAVSSL